MSELFSRHNKTGNRLTRAKVATPLAAMALATVVGYSSGPHANPATFGDIAGFAQLVDNLNTAQHQKAPYKKHTDKTNGMVTYVLDFVIPADGFVNRGEYDVTMVTADDHLIDNSHELDVQSIEVTAVQTSPKRQAEAIINVGLNTNNGSGGVDSEDMDHPYLLTYRSFDPQGNEHDAPDEATALTYATQLIANAGIARPIDLQYHPGAQQ